RATCSPYGCLPLTAEPACAPATSVRAARSVTSLPPRAARNGYTPGEDSVQETYDRRRHTHDLRAPRTALRPRQPIPRGGSGTVAVRTGRRRPHLFGSFSAPCICADRRAPSRRTRTGSGPCPRGAVRRARTYSGRVAPHGTHPLPEPGHGHRRTPTHSGLHH